MGEMHHGRDPFRYEMIRERSTKHGEDLTKDEACCITYSARCPDCNGFLLRGPSGGASVNMLCGICPSRFNMADGYPMGERITTPYIRIMSNAE